MFDGSTVRYHKTNKPEQHTQMSVTTAAAQEVGGGGQSEKRKRGMCNKKVRARVFVHVNQLLSSARDEQSCSARTSHAKSAQEERARGGRKRLVVCMSERAPSHSDKCTHVSARPTTHNHTQLHTQPTCVTVPGVQPLTHDGGAEVCGQEPCITCTMPGSNKAEAVAQRETERVCVCVRVRVRERETEIETGTGTEKRRQACTFTYKYKQTHTRTQPAQHRNAPGRQGA